MHAWVDVTASWTSPSPSLLLAWRRIENPRPSDGDGWKGWVISVDAQAAAHGGDPVVHQFWLPSHLILPAFAPRPETTVKYRPVNADR
jgi:hypothetical protein